ncbi:hypothetical protein GYMLUDRAFT_40314 [Collybiopsis luxurians FD-317 M1]|uniref:Cytochrome c oxidase-assembly factor COX23, mitochondrial n=1 Tax=Collybiopsis luxurians FD-317 M1 TaxID=944289 RepID=A0A0D0D441_9AGAR|nr:hypothetical protein GYMLUDRAFT_40314 [Collybiopsis luxurians FD-317 M1]
MSTSTNDAPLPPPSSNTKPLNYREQFQGRDVVSRFIDPCEAASKASLACMMKHDFDREKCFEYFQAYRECKNAWIEQRKDDRRHGRPSS